MRRTNTGLEINDAACVARRALILAAVTCRGSIESGASDPEAASLHTRLIEWLTMLGLWENAEFDEEKILRAPLGTLEPKNVIWATWQVEGLAVLAWALKRFEFPEHDIKAGPYAVADAVWFLRDDAEEVIRTARLRSAAKRNACRELLYAIHVRLTTFSRTQERANFASWVEQAWTNALPRNVAHLFAQDDLAIDGKPMIEAKNARVEECRHIAHERHKAIIWLAGQYSSYSQTPVDT